MEVVAFLGAAGAATALAWRARRHTSDTGAALDSTAEAGTPAPPAADSAGYAGRVVLVTGSSSGIGRSIALRLAREGARIAVHYHTSADGAAATRHACIAAGAADAIVVQANLGDASGAEAQRLVDAVLAAYGHIDVLVNNSGVYEELVCDDPAISFAQWKRVWSATVALNLTAAADLSFLVSRHMVERAARARTASAAASGTPAPIGAIVNVGSRGAMRGEPQAWAYGASKAGMHQLAQSMAAALGRCACGDGCELISHGTMGSAGPAGSGTVEWRHVHACIMSPRPLTRPSMPTPTPCAPASGMASASRQWRRASLRRPWPRPR
jgi:NAD(P)-dependent dehydrogenase (short-subunit alcohol dehydrogenase family)